MYLPLHCTIVRQLFVRWYARKIGEATLDNPVKLDGFDFDKKPCTTATVPVVQGQKLSRAPLLSTKFLLIM